jgi:hypothetical protein
VVVCSGARASEGRALRWAWLLGCACAAAASLAGCSFDTSPIPPEREQPPPDEGNGRTDAQVVIPTMDAQVELDSGPIPVPDAAPPDAAQPDATIVDMDATVTMDAAPDGAPPDAAPDAAEDTGAPDAPIEEDAMVCPELPCVCPQHAPLAVAGDDCPPPICGDDGCKPQPDCELVYDRTSAYYFCPEGHTWGDAAEHCTEVDMHLASIEDSQEDQLIFSHLSAKAWLGGRDGADEEGLWRWQDGRAFFRDDDDDEEALGYVNWHDTEPNNNGLSAGAADCLLFWFENGVWADGSCGDENGYVCEAERQ